MTTQRLLRLIGRILLGLSFTSLATLSPSPISARTSTHSSVAIAVLPSSTTPPVGESETAPLTAAYDLYAWEQFASFVDTFNLLKPDSGFTRDQDWQEVDKWKSKKELNFGGQDPPPCPEPKDDKNSPDPGLSTVVARVAKSREVPFQYRLLQDEAGDLMAHSLSADCNEVNQIVLYNQTASDYISGKYPDSHGPLTESATLDAILKEKDEDKRRISLPNGSVVIKAIWEPIQFLGGKAVVRIWDPSNSYFQGPNPGKFGFGSILTWPSRVTVDESTQAACSNTDYLTNPTTATAIAAAQWPAPVPISCFAHVSLGKVTYVLVGINIVHATSKGGLLWFTFVWTNRATSDSPPVWLTGENRRPEYLTTLPHYLMNRTDAESEKSSGKICFNPYLEGTKPNGPVSDCVRCHQFATYQSVGQGASAMAADLLLGPQADPANNGIDTQHGSSSKPLSDAFVKKYLAGTLPTGFLWSIVTNVEPGKM